MKQQCIVVTGAAGIAGAELARHLNEAGILVIGVDIADRSPAEAAMAGFLGGVDLTSAEATEETFSRIAEAHGQIDGLANIAGGFSWETVEDGSPDTWNRLWKLNVLTSLHACRAAMSRFGADGGSIVNVSAAATERAALGMAAYTATKSAVSRLTESLSEELKPRKIRVNAVLPTIIDTPDNRRDMPDADPAEWVQPGELASTIAFLLSKEASAVNGALLRVAGRL
ncbi:MAG: SDR family oxidoreductase [Hyphomonadaceae bacterium]|nr:SDR family oxidoreductase [Hyphomonadaceae bacterium]